MAERTVRKITVAKSAMSRSMTREQMQTVCNHIFSEFGHQSSYVLLSLAADSKMPACALGINFRNVPIGEITIHKGLSSILNPEELTYVIAHEAAHIELNHLPPKMMVNVGRSILKEAAKDNGLAAVIDLALDFFNILNYGQGTLSVSAQLTKDQELEADFYAVRATGNKDGAVSALTKLVGGNLDTPSHVWETLGIDLPVMSMKERVDIIRSRF